MYAIELEKGEWFVGVKPYFTRTKFIESAKTYKSVCWAKNAMVVIKKIGLWPDAKIVDVNK